MPASFFSKPKVNSLDAPEFEELLKNTNDAILLDVRTEEENFHTRIPNSIQIDIYESYFGPEVLKLDKSKTYFVYCRSGSRSYSACAFMMQNGFEKVFNLQDGIASWNGEIERH